MLNNIVELEKELKDWFKAHPKVLVALSGGVDSCLVAFLARKFNGSTSAVSLIGVSPSLKKRDFQLAVDFCNENGIKYLAIHPNEINDDNYSANPVNRCYYCKSALYKEMLSVRDVYYPGYEILNGNNYSDRGDYRPGMSAAKEFLALSPLMECKLEKEAIRKLAHHYNLRVWDKPASPCMSSRFPYGEKITVDKLGMVEKAEELVNSLGFSDVRVRIRQAKAKVEVPSDEIEALHGKVVILNKELTKIGFDSIEIDTEGLVSGKLNREINKTE